MAFRIQLRRDPALNWTVNNPILLDGEMGYETDTQFMKIGDGVTPWNNLGYWSSVSNTPNYPNLPVPDLKLYSTKVTDNPYNIEWFDRNSNSPGDPLAILVNPPAINAIDIPESLLNSSTLKVYVEMVTYRRKSKRSKLDKKKSGYVIPSAHYANPNDGRYPAWGKNFFTRSGEHDFLASRMNIDKPNHFQVTTSGQKIDVGQYLNGRFSKFDVNYKEYPSGDSSISTLVPLTRACALGKISGSKGYSAIYTSLRVAFRYIIWDPEANSGRGNIISGPLSKVLVIQNAKFPFVLNWPNLANGGGRRYTLSGWDKYTLRCSFENML